MILFQISFQSEIFQNHAKSPNPITECTLSYAKQTTNQHGSLRVINSIRSNNLHQSV